MKEKILKTLNDNLLFTMRYTGYEYMSSVIANMATRHNKQVDHEFCIKNISREDLKSLKLNEMFEFCSLDNGVILSSCGAFLKGIIIQRGNMSIIVNTRDLNDLSSYIDNKVIEIKEDIKGVNSNTSVNGRYINGLKLKDKYKKDGIILVVQEKLEILNVANCKDTFEIKSICYEVKDENEIL